MATRNRMNHAGQSSGQYQGYSSHQGGPEQLGSLNSSGLGLSGVGGRRSTEQSGPRRMSQQAAPFTVMDSRALATRGAVGMAGSGVMPTPRIEGIINNLGQHLGGRSLPYNEGGLLGPGGVHQLSSGAMRGPNNSTLYESFGLISRQQVHLGDGSLRTMYSSPDVVGRGIPDVGLGGGLSSEGVGKGGLVNGYRGYMTPEEAEIAMATTSQNMHGMGYQGRQVVRDGRLVQVGGYGREDEGPFVHPMSPRAMPMSPRRDDVVRMMSPCRDDISPPMTSRRDAYDDIPQMMSPRRDDMSPALSPRRRDYSNLEMMGRMRRPLSPISREEELLERQDYSMNPRMGVGLTPPMSPRIEGWGYEAPSISPSRHAAPMSPRQHSPARTPLWKNGSKPPSQWDVLPIKTGLWSGSDREARVGDSRVYGADIMRGVPERVGGGYGAEMNPVRDDLKRMGQGWSLSRKGQGGDGLYVRPEQQDGLLRPPIVSGPSQMGRNVGDESRVYQTTNAKQFVYKTVVNQRVGMVTKYIERERAERAAAERSLKEGTDKTNRRKNGHAVDSKPFRTDPREKDVSSAGAGSRYDNKSENNAGGVSGKPLSLVAAIEIATKQINEDKTGENKSANKSFNTSAKAAGSSVAGNGNTAQQTTAAAVATTAGTSTTPPNTRGATEDPKGPKSEAGKGIGDTQRKDAGSSGSGRQNGVSSNSANGHSQINVKTGSKPGEPRDSPKRPSLVMEIERAKKSRMLADQQRHLREVEETYYDANELSVDFISKVNRSGSQYSRMINDDPYLRRRYLGGQPGLHCLVCGKASKIYASIHDLLTHAQGSQSKRIDHMGFRKALTDIWKPNTTSRSVGQVNIKDEDEMIIWPPIVVVENKRTNLGADRRWDGVANTDMTLLLHGLHLPA